VVGAVALPNIVSDYSKRFGAIFLKRPASLGLVSYDFVKEVTHKDGIVCLQVLFLGIILHISEVRIKVKLVTFFN